ncbi:SRPBCC family protein [Sphingomonas sp. HITSZ_GF]|uniref:SRPBCC family protein n=1 Tax=Sphingomonas sp. HITSZ_GF TaxID=3037247 RepID=UPI00240D9F19|nr:SRPBCC family protein [Sphingomonas sp. HITSZ_GF]MDG2532835.1 SRPBCC family protein [Sphingomonas sp. HITSZ_GF]
MAEAVHDKFVIERRFRQSPAKVFAAFATEEGKARWFSGPNELWDLVDRRFDFRVGGTEHLEGQWKSGTVTRFDASYHDIVADSRIVYAYRMQLNGKPISVSLCSIELLADGEGTRLLHTEHGIYLDGYEDKGSRFHGISLQYDKLDETLPG